VKNKIILSILLIVFLVKNSTAQVTQSTIRPAIRNNTATVNVPQYSVTLTKDTTFKIPNPYMVTAFRDTNYYPHYILEITGMPNETLYISFQVSAKTKPSWSNSTTLGVVYRQPVVLNNNGIAILNLKTDSDSYSFPTSLEKTLSNGLYTIINPIINNSVKFSYVGANFYRLNAYVEFTKNGGLTDKYVESFVAF
jgi:hypothetical protein